MSAYMHIFDFIWQDVYQLVRVQGCIFNNIYNLIKTNVLNKSYSHFTITILSINDLILSLKPRFYLIFLKI